MSRFENGLAVSCGATVLQPVRRTLAKAEALAAKDGGVRPAPISFSILKTLLNWIETTIRKAAKAACKIPVNYYFSTGYGRFRIG